MLLIEIGYRLMMMMLLMLMMLLMIATREIRNL